MQPIALSPLYKTSENVWIYVGHADFDKPNASHLRSIQTILQWLNMAKFTYHPVLVHVWLIGTYYFTVVKFGFVKLILSTDVALGTLSVCLTDPAAGLTNSISTIRTEIGKIYKSASAIDREYFPTSGKRGTQASEQKARDFLIGTAMITKAFESIVDIEAFPGTVVGDLTYLIEKHSCYSDCEFPALVSISSTNDLNNSEKENEQRLQENE